MPTITSVAGSTPGGMTNDPNTPNLPPGQNVAADPEFNGVQVLQVAGTDLGKTVGAFIGGPKRAGVQPSGWEYVKSFPQSDSLTLIMPHTPIPGQYQLIMVTADVASGTFTFTAS
jgi:hypothetical protein